MEWGIGQGLNVGSGLSVPHFSCQPDIGGMLRRDCMALLLWGGVSRGGATWPAPPSVGMMGAQVASHYDVPNQ